MAGRKIDIRFGADITDFEKKMTTMARSLNKLGKQMENVGKEMSMKLTAPILALGALSVKAFAEEEVALAKLSAAVHANGKDVNSTLTDYKNFASELQKTTTVGDETTLALLQMAETMQAANPKESVKGAIALSKAMGIDLETALKAVEKANAGQYTAVQRLIPTIALMGSESEKAAMFQKILADGMNIAEAEANTTQGRLIQLKNAVGDLMEQFGAIISKALVPFTTKIRGVVERLQNMDDGTKKLIVTILGIVAAIGPVLLIAGKMMTTWASMIVTVGKLKNVITGLNLAMLKNPFFLVAVAIAALVAGFIALSSKVGGVGNAFKIMGAVSMASIKTTWEWVKATGIFLFNVSKLWMSLLVAPWKVMAQTVANVFKVLPAVIKNALTGNFSEAGKALMDAFKVPLEKEVKNITNQINNLTEPFQTAKVKTQEYWNEVSQLNKQLAKQASETKNVTKEQTALNAAITSGGEGGGTGAGRGRGTGIVPISGKAAGLLTPEIEPPKTLQSVEQLSGKMQILNEIYAKIAESARIATERAEAFGTQSGLNAEMQNIYAQAIDELITRLPKATAELELLKNEMLSFNEAQTNAIDISSELSSAVQSSLQSTIEDMATLTGEMISGIDTQMSFLDILLTNLSGFMKSFGSALIAVGVAKIAFEKLEMSGLGAVIAGAALIAASTVVKSQIKAPKLAKGGLATAPTLALVGDNPRASVDPEVIAPLSKLKGMIGSGGSQTIIPDVRISGQDLLIIFNNAQKRKYRMA